MIYLGVLAQVGGGGGSPQGSYVPPAQHSMMQVGHPEGIKIDEVTSDSAVLVLPSQSVQFLNCKYVITVGGTNIQRQEIETISTENRFQIKALKPGTEYTVWIKIRDERLKEESSPIIVKFTTLPAATIRINQPPMVCWENQVDPPRNLRLIKNAGRSVTVRWDSPTCRVNRYKIRLRRQKYYGEVLEIHDNFFEASKTQSRFDNLKTGWMYTVMVSSIEGENESEESRVDFRFKGHCIERVYGQCVKWKYQLVEPQK